jgi:hypothetical protein
MTNGADQIKADVAALQAASAAAADQIATLTDEILALQAGQITDDQIEALHVALSDVTSELVQAVEESESELGGTEGGAPAATPAAGDQEAGQHGSQR